MLRLLRASHGKNTHSGSFLLHGEVMGFVILLFTEQLLLFSLANQWAAWLSKQEGHKSVVTSVTVLRSVSKDSEQCINIIHAGLSQLWDSIGRV